MQNAQQQQQQQLVINLFLGLWIHQAINHFSFTLVGIDVLLQTLAGGIDSPQPTPGDVVTSGTVQPILMGCPMTERWKASDLNVPFAASTVLLKISVQMQRWGLPIQAHFVCAASAGHLKPEGS